MAESITRPDVNATAGAPEQANTPSQRVLENREVTTTRPAAVIWTPRFIVIFLVVLVVGLSVQSMLTLLWSSHLIQAPWVLLASMLYIAGLQLALFSTTRSWWLRAGSIFACLWIIFSTFNQFLDFFTLEPLSPIPAYLNAITCSALLGSYICFSLERTSLTTWDTWFFRLTLFIGMCITGVIFFVTVATGGPWSAIDSGIAALGLVFSALVWWLRPSCWQTQASPTFLFGLTPALALLLNVTSLGKGSTNFFLSQVALLTFLLATLRVLQAERCNKQSVES